MAEKSCMQCAFRARYDNNPQSLLGRLWKWHIKFCPGWKSFVLSMPEEEQNALIKQYGYPRKK